MIKIMIADDQSLIRESLNIILSVYEEFKICSLVSNGNEVLEQIKTEMPDVILMDVRMPEMDGVTCTKYVKTLYPQIKVIILTTFDDDEYIYNALKYGASGYLLKGLSPDEFYKSICTVVNGGSIISPKAATKVFNLFSENQITKGHVEVQREVQDLSAREWEVIEKVSNGLSNKEIAHEMFVSEGTVRNNLSVILEKLQLRDRTQLAIWYIQNGKILRKVNNK